MGNIELKPNAGGTDWDISTPGDGTQAIGASLAAAAVSADVVLRSGLQDLTGEWDVGNQKIVGILGLDPNANGAGTIGLTDLAWNTLFCRKIRPDVGADFQFFTGPGVLAFEVTSSNGIVFNENASASMDLRYEGDNDISTFTVDAPTDRVGVGVTLGDHLGKLHVDQNDVAGAIPALVLDQADLSEEMTKFITTIGTGNPIEAVAAKTLTTTHFIKVEIPGPLTVYFPVGTIA